MLATLYLTVLAQVSTAAVPAKASDHGYVTSYEVPASVDRERRQDSEPCGRWTDGISRCIREEGGASQGNCLGSCSLINQDICTDEQCGYCEAKACTGIIDADSSATAFNTYLSCKGSCNVLPTATLIDLCVETCSCNICSDGLELYRSEPTAQPTTSPSPASTVPTLSVTRSQTSTGQTHQNDATTTTTEDPQLRVINDGYGSGDRANYGKGDVYGGKKSKRMGRKSAGKSKSDNSGLMSAKYATDSIASVASIAAACIFLVGSASIIALRRRRRNAGYSAIASVGHDGYAVPMEKSIVVSDSNNVTPQSTSPSEHTSLLTH